MFKILRKGSYICLLGALILLNACQTEPFVKKPSSDSQRHDLANWPALKSPLAQDVALEAQIENILTRMSLAEKVGQIMQGEIKNIKPGDIKKYHLGSVLNGGGSMPYRKERPSQSDWLKLADSYWAESMDDSDGKVAIPVIWGTDAVHGHNNLIGATIFPHNVGLGAMRNPRLIREIGQATAEEVRATGIEWVFAPTIAVARNDRWGRTYESYSEDPGLVASYSKEMVIGLQGKAASDQFLNDSHVIATAKHFLGDGGTEGGDDQGNTKLSEAEFVRIHNAGYPPALEAGVQTVMASFSSWNGQKMHGNQYLLTDVLKGRMGFDGLVVGDWNGHGQVPGCTNASCPQAINAGVDLIMVPDDWRTMIEHTIKQVESGQISMARLDDAVRRILRVKLRANLFAKAPSQRISAAVKNSIGSAAHRDIARRAVRQSLVLLKNDNQLLPLKPNARVLVAGDGADNIPKQSGGWTVTWQGTGTTNEYFPGATSIYKGIAEHVNAAGGTVELAVDGRFKQKPDVAIVVFGEDPYAEGQGDVNTLEFQPGNKIALKLLKKFKSEGIPVVSVFLSGRPLWVNPEMNASDAFVAAWLPGSEGGGVADVLFKTADGKIAYDFKGRLAFSWPRLPLQDELHAGQKGYDPLFAYGYGLSYGSSLKGPGTLEEQVAGIASQTAADVDFYVGRPLQPWNVYIGYNYPTDILSGGHSKTTDGDITLQTIDKVIQEDALLFSWNKSKNAKLAIFGGSPLNLTTHSREGVLSLDLKSVKADSATAAIAIGCGQDCERVVSITDKVLAMKDKGWQTVQIPLSCFKLTEKQWSAVQAPFTLITNGTGQLGLANIRFLLKGSANVTCP